VRCAWVKRTSNFLSILSANDLQTGEAIYWTATAVAGLIVVLSVANYLSNVSVGWPVVPIAPLLLAVVVWLIGTFAAARTDR